MKIRYYDQSGKLVSGAFFALTVPLGDFGIYMLGEKNTDKWVLSHCPPPETNANIWVEVCVHSSPVHACPTDKSHVTNWEFKSAECLDMCGSGRVSHFVPDSIGESVVVRKDFGDQLVHSGLKGPSITTLPIQQNQSQAKDPKISRLEFKGRSCSREPKFRVPDTNRCPFCGWGPVVCPGCFHITHDCPKCKSKIVALEEQLSGPGDPRFVVEAGSSSNLVVEADQWDGSDFIKLYDGGMVTKKALDWLLSMHAAPFIAEPCRANVERLTGQQLRDFEAMWGQKVAP